MWPINNTQNTETHTIQMEKTSTSFSCEALQTSWRQKMHWTSKLQRWNLHESAKSDLKPVLRPTEQRSLPDADEDMLYVWTLVAAPNYKAHTITVSPDLFIIGPDPTGLVDAMPHQSILLSKFKSFILYAIYSNRCVLLWNVWEGEYRLIFNTF